MIRAASVFLLAILSLSNCLATRSGETPRQRTAKLDLKDLPDGAKLVWLGDSLTWQTGYTDGVEQHFAIQHPRKRFHFVNLARRGDTAGDVLDRFETEVTPLAPGALLVMLGINDAGHLGLRRDLLRIYLTRMGELVDLVRRRTRARLVLIDPTCVLPGTYERDQKNRMLLAMAEGLQELGRERGVAVARIHAPFCEALGRADGAELMADLEHPSERGHGVLASILLDLLDPEFR